MSSADVAIEPGRDGVDPNPRAQVQRGQSGVVRECGLGGAVGGEPAAGHPSHRRGDVDDAAAAGVLEHQRHGGDGQRVGGGDVEGERALEVLRRGGQQPVRHGAADVVDDDVQSSERLDGLAGQLRGDLGLGQVGGDDVGAPARGADLFGDGL